MTAENERGRPGRGGTPFEIAGGVNGDHHTPVASATTGPANDLGELLASLDGPEVPGGCDDCAAIQTIKTISGGVSTITIAQDSWCPTLRRINLKRGRL